MKTSKEQRLIKTETKRIEDLKTDIGTLLKTLYDLDYFNNLKIVKRISNNISTKAAELLYSEQRLNILYELKGEK
ncbi:MAG: hypothetical protein GY714_20855 [Desulfobacterales bacterium]|nr:hypothetical protein [Desulfobacterales bacterium]